MNAMERLNKKMNEMDSRIVAGLDPTYDILPPKLKEGFNTSGKKRDVMISFCYQYIDIIADLVPAIKINSAFFEGREFETAYREVAEYAKNKGLFVIGDLKRADIGSTSKAYADAWLAKNEPFDAITVNPYFGTDGIKPFIQTAAENGKGIFVLVKTSNKSSDEIQDKVIFDTKNRIYEQVADLVNCWGSTVSDGYRYNPIGAVVGATHPKEAQILRARMKNTMFLVPGYGAQGATADDVAVNFDEDGLGAIVNSSRGLMCAYKKEQYKDIAEKEGWEEATRRAVQDAICDINRGLKNNR